MDLLQALSLSRYAQRMVDARPEYRDTWNHALERPLDWPTTVTQPFAKAVSVGDADALATTLRQARQHVMLHTLARDLAGLADLDEVCTAMGRLAEDALTAAVALHQMQLIETRGTPSGTSSGDVQPFIIAGMGKLGGCELNVSSDIDLVFLYPEEGETNGARPLSNHEFFVRLGQRVIAALDEMTGDGFVFRVDMRLRPYGDAAPLAVSFDALEQYLMTQGRMWERYAWLKARPLSGNRDSELHQLITPFVYRKYLDYDAYEGLRDVREQIRTQGKTRGYEHNIKLGAGGIRDIEFIAQALQIVRGGRAPDLQQRGTRAALRALCKRALLSENTVHELLTAYDFLRRVEHRLQYRDDLATQTLPEDPESQEFLTSSMHFPSSTAFQQALRAHRSCVTHHFETLLGYDDIGKALPVHTISDNVRAASDHFLPLPAANVSSLPPLPWIAPEALNHVHQILASRGFANPDTIIDRITHTRESKRYATLPERSQQRFDLLTGQLLDVAHTTTHPSSLSTLSPHSQAGAADALFLRLFALLETISRRSAYLALLSEHPKVLPALARLLAASSWAADYLNRHPILLDELLTQHTLSSEPDWLAWRDELTRLLSTHADDTERQMDELRHFQHTQTFRLLAQDLAGQLTVERLADHLTALADLILEVTLHQCWQSLATETDAPRFAIIGYGKLGSKELSYGSDLDLVFLYDIDAEDPLEDAATARYTRLAQRMNTWLTSTTAAGNLYTTDLRLRPDGGSGLLISRWDAFVRYQRDKAWTFEHQALTRARFIAGDTELGAAFMRERTALLQRRRDTPALIRDIAAMRNRMHEGHVNRTGLFDVKHDQGGMIDVEFIVQFLVLAHAHRYPALSRNTGNVALLASAATLELIPPREAEAVTQAYRAYRRWQHAAHLQGDETSRIDPALCEKERAAVTALWNAQIRQAADSQ